MDLVLGVDAGGTASRAVVATLAGQVIGRGSAGPGNPVSAGSAAAIAIRTAISRALGHVPASRVAAGVLGVSGADGTTEARFAPMWRDLGLTCPLTIVGDVVTAFAAGTARPSGAVLIAGTGAIAARITGHRVTATADGLGWLLGDEGSGRWIGLQTVRAAVRDWSGPLGELVAARSGATSPEEAVRWAQSLPFAEIGALAPVVCAAARSGCPGAAAIIAAAVDRLLATLDSLTTPPGPSSLRGPLAARDSLASPAGSRAGREPLGAPSDVVGPSGHGAAGLGTVAGRGEDALSHLRDLEPVVLAGGLLVGDTPVRDGVLGVLEKRGTPCGTAREPAGAAAWLAASGLGLGTAELHAALCGV
jgi:glucosamine kinase